MNASNKCMNIHSICSEAHVVHDNGYGRMYRIHYQYRHSLSEVRLTYSKRGK